MGATTFFNPKGDADSPDFKKLRVAGYCRVSTLLEVQESSITLQARALREQITANPMWEFAGVYVEDGLSGTQADKRPQLMDLLKACEEGHIDRIITKSLSRMSRNTLDTLKIIRRLKELGVSIFFQKENIDTAAAYSEMLLTIMAAFSQQESLSISENVTWGIRKRYEQGTSRWSRLYGFTKEGDDEYVIVEDEARIVRRIFDEAEKGVTVNQIVKGLNNDSIPAPSGKKWQGGTVGRFLHNERYCGDIMLQKTVTEDHLTHRSVENDFTEVPGYYLDDHHKGIVEREQFERVQKVLELKSMTGGSSQYPFGELLICPYCGKPMRQEYIRFGNNPGRVWVCKSEDSPHFIMRSGIVEEAVAKGYNDVDPTRQGDAEDGQRDADKAEKALAWKADHPTVESAEFYWIDRTVESITFGKHEGFKPPKSKKCRNIEQTDEGDFTVTIRWKWGQETTVPSGIEKIKDHPKTICEQYEREQERLRMREQADTQPEAEENKDTE